MIDIGGSENQLSADVQSGEYRSNKGLNIRSEDSYRTNGRIFHAFGMLLLEDAFGSEEPRVHEAQHHCHQHQGKSTFHFLPSELS